jgi:uncharacterized protein (TIGR02271 family)
MSAAPMGQPSSRSRRRTRTRSTEVARTTIPVVEEELVVGKRTRPTGGVRVHKTTSSEEQLVDVPCVKEEVRVERVPLDRPATEAIGPHYEGDTLVIPVFEEVVRVEKHLVLREEVRITKLRRTGHERRRVRVRRERAEVTPTPPPARGATRPAR